MGLSKTEYRWAREAKEAKKVLLRAIATVEANRIDGGVRCVAWGTNLCSGRMVVRKHTMKCGLRSGNKCTCKIRKRIFVAAAGLPTYCQCDGCGHAPGLEMQLVLLGAFMTKT